jgi:5-methylcytosine-specific restriction enzyme A
LVKPVYDLLRDSPGALAAAVRTLARTYFTGTDPTGLLAELGLTDLADRSPAESALAALTKAQRQSLVRQYQRLCGRADAHWQDLDDKRVTRTISVPVRYEQARTAVMLRSQGHCENPRCTGDIQDLTDAGDPILEVDHLDDLAKDGADLPAQMIALCPNCHAIKTRGRTRGELKKGLVAEARRRHDELTKP